MSYKIEIDGEKLRGYNKDDVIGMLVQALINRGIKTVVDYPDGTYIGVNDL